MFEVLRDPRGHEIVERHLPGLAHSSILHTLHSYPVGLVVDTEESLDTAGREALLAEIEAIPTEEPAPVREQEQYAAPSVSYESGEVELGSAAVVAPSSVPVYERFEVELRGPSHGNPFVDVDLSAIVDGPGGAVRVPGFYDGDGVFRLRWMPEAPGEYAWTTSSTARSLDGITGAVSATPPLEGRHGPVRVADTFHFAHADGTRHRPLGTTSYAWTHQGDELEERTLATLAEAPFTKIRMGVFPKSYLFNENEPVLYPFEGSPEEGFDHRRPSIPFWRHFEHRIDQLAALGIEADLILFHAYDRWGFSTMDPVADDRYVRYAVARLASFANVWWSLANEYDLLFEKTEEDWERFAAIVVRDDPSRHLLSIHNCREFYDYSRPWITHASIQRQDVYKTSESTTQWRRWGKPVVIDECAYEGDIDQGWGNITGEELVRRFWEGALRGGYVGHGETYVHPDDVLWWSKGGELRGTSPARIAFLESVLAEGPANGLEPILLDWDVPRAGVEGEYYLYYFGFDRPTYRRFLLEPDVSYTVDVIDTWGMTVERLPGTYSGRFRIALPGRQYIAVRLLRAS
ncbi:alpha-L-rhamnosidase [Rathayibacter sp. Leaf185]|nr:alpha-L-rhamnosidase [Rathayibacter sp. Leaf294]KQS14258.1 alpha-L-rhamnosidase [Rathayibacter sp. Leaf185]